MNLITPNKIEQDFTDIQKVKPHTDQLLDIEEEIPDKPDVIKNIPKNELK